MATNRTWLRSPEAAAYMGLKPSTFRRLVEAGEIPYTRLGPQSHYLFNPDELDKVIASNSVAGAAS